MHDRHPIDLIADERIAAGLGGRWYGVYPALVCDVKDPDGQGRVKVTLPWSPDASNGRYEAWARLATLMGGQNRGSWFIPDRNDEVLVLFEAGDPRRPYVVGGLWNGADKPPAAMDGAGKNDKKVLRSRNGVKLTLDDTQGQESMILETPGGQTITLKDGPGSIVITDSNNNAVKLEPQGVTVSSTGKVTVQATQVEVTASMVNVNSGMAKFSGIIDCAMLKTNSVVSETYSPGAGNLL
ncbi:MAG TPA: phage baseplate assembly protein V [Isosphaeraceae bacterium]|nr:phage baseplate assembly protein V [Isosphaeraceae bacterium]